MSFLSRRRVLGLAIVVDVALYARPAPVAAKALAQRLELPPRHLETLLQALVRANILKGVRGPKGGYELARERRRISAGDIVRAVSNDDFEARTPQVIETVIAAAILESAADFMAKLNLLTIADLCLRAEALSAADKKPVGADFTI